MTQLKHSYYFVRGHLDNDHFEEVTDDPNQEDFIQETCDECGDNDWIEGEFDTYEDDLKIIKYQNYTPEYRNEMIGRLKQLR